MKILIIGPSWIGDMVMAHSLFQSLLHTSPSAELHLMAPPHCKPLAEAMPEIQKFIPLDIPHGEFNFSKRKNIGHALKQQQYDQAYILPNSFKSALIPFFANIPTRIGYRGEFRYGLLNQIKKINKKKYPLLAHRYWALNINSNLPTDLPTDPLNQIPSPRLTLPKTWTTEVHQKFQLCQHKKLAVLCPGAEYGPAKQWPKTHYSELAKTLTQQGYAVWILGTQKDQSTGDWIKTQSQSQSQANTTLINNLAGKTSLSEAMVILKQADIVITNDSGLMHIRAAFDLPQVALFGSTSEIQTPPLSQQAQILALSKNQIPCRPCFERICPKKSPEEHMACLKNIHPQDVLKKINI